MYEEFPIANLDDTKKFAKLIAGRIEKSYINYSFKDINICLYGDLGSGKTTFAGYLIQQLLSKDLLINSPTFNIYQIYTNDLLTINHFDLYRINSCEELLEIGIDEILLTGINIIEWPEIAENILSKKSIKIQFYNNDNIRYVKFAVLT